MSSLSTPATLRHILVGCKTSLSQGRYTWRHNQVLRQLAIILEGRRTTTNALLHPVPGFSKTTTFVRAGQLPVKPTTKMETTLLDTARDWKMQVDLDQKLSCPPEIVTTNLRPDLILWSTSQKSLFIVELTVPWEAAIGEANERKRLKYSDLVAEAVQRGWWTQLLPVEVGCRGFVATATTRLLKGLGVRGQALQQAITSLSEAAERSSNWLWIKRKDPKWAAKWPRGVKAEGSAPGMPGVAVEPFGGVVGLSTKHQGRRVPTWLPQWSDYPYSPLKMSTKCRLF